MFEIKLYGEVVPFQDAWLIEQGGYINLTFLQNQLKEAKGSDVLVRINSMGGDVDEGFAIYSELRRYAKENNAKIRTLAEGRCASIATVFFLAGDERVVTEHTSPFVHYAWCYTMGDAKTLQRVAVDLEKCNQQIAQHYANHTNLTVDEALELMGNDTSISPEECLNLRFATEIEEVLRPVALKSVLNKSNNNKKMAEEKKSKNSVVQSFLNLLRGKGILNKEVFKADGGIVDFYELGDNDMVKVGDKARIDGQNATGSVLMQSGETYVFSDDGSGALIEIVAKTEDKGDGTIVNTEEQEAVIADLKKQLEDKQAEIDDLKAEIAELKGEKTEVENALAKATEVIKNAKSTEPILNKKEQKTELPKKEKEDVSEAVKNWKKNKLKNLNNK